MAECLELLNEQTLLNLSWQNSNESNFDQKADTVKLICDGIRQEFIFSELDIELIEHYVDQVVFLAEHRAFKNKTVDRAPLRNKYFFGEGYTYGSQLLKKGRGMERLYPRNEIEPIPYWLHDLVINPLVNAQIVPEGFVNSVVVNDYQQGGCIVSHVDPPHIFDRPIISLSLMSNGALSFGCKFTYKPIRVTEPVFCLPLPRGVVTLLRYISYDPRSKSEELLMREIQICDFSGYAANNITHCIRPQDTLSRRAVILLRRVLPTAPRLPELEIPLKLNKSYYENLSLSKRNDKIYKKYSTKTFKTIKKTNKAFSSRKNYFSDLNK